MDKPGDGDGLPWTWGCLDFVRRQRIKSRWKEVMGGSPNICVINGLSTGRRAASFASICTSPWQAVDQIRRRPGIGPEQVNEKSSEIAHFSNHSGTRSQIDSECGDASFSAVLRRRSNAAPSALQHANHDALQAHGVTPPHCSFVQTRRRARRQPQRYRLAASRSVFWTLVRSAAGSRT